MTNSISYPQSFPTRENRLNLFRHIYRASKAYNIKNPRCHLMRHADTAMRQALPRHHHTCMHSYTGIRQTHPVRHRRALPATTGRNCMLPRIRFFLQHGTIRCINNTEAARTVFSLFLQYDKAASRSRRRFSTGRNRPIQSNATIHINSTTLLPQTYVNRARSISLLEQFGILIHHHGVQVITVTHKKLVRILGIITIIRAGRNSLNTSLQRSYSPLIFRHKTRRKEPPA